MKIYKKQHLQSIEAGSFNRTLQHMQTTECLFITAHRDELSSEDKNKQNKLLEADIKSSGLTFFKARGGYVENYYTDTPVEVVEDTFFVINNKYTPEHFVKLAIAWCKTYNQDSVLITHPNPRSGANKGSIDIVGRYYNQHGQIEMEFDHVTFKNVQEYFSQMFGKKFVMASEGEYTETKGWDVFNVSGRVLGINTFKNKYGHLI